MCAYKDTFHRLYPEINRERWNQHYFLFTFLYFNILTDKICNCAGITYINSDVF